MPNLRGRITAFLVLFSAGLLGPLPVQAQLAAPRYEVTVSAGDVDRRATVVSFSLPSNLSDGAYHLETESGRSRPLQLGRNRAWFVVDQLSAGQQRTYQLVEGNAAPAKVELNHHERSLAISVGKQDIVRYWTDERPLPRADLDSIYLRGGYLHPVRTPSGRIVTGDYAEDHPHHHGIWSSWTKTEFRGRTPDFWNVQDGTGDVVPITVDSTWSGPVHAGLQARHRYVDHSADQPVTALYEQWGLRVYDVSPVNGETPYHVFDLRVVQTTASSSPLTLLPYHYGGVAVRGPDAWYGPKNAHFLTAAGKDRSTGNETRARWTYIGGAVDNEQAGLAMLSHPQNWRAPQPVRIHPEMPYFCFAPSQVGRWSIRPGSPYVARYRFVVFDGAPSPPALDRLWTDYAYPPGVTVTKTNADGDP